MALLHLALLVIVCLYFEILTLSSKALFVISCVLYLIYATIDDEVRSRMITSRYSAVIHNMQECKKLLRHSSLESRARPNQRLVTAFGIDNAFTTVDLAYQKRFVSKAKGLMRTLKKDWLPLADIALKTIGPPLSTVVRNEQPAPLSLTRLVQVLVFRVVVFKFFPDAGSPSDEDVEYITSTINSQWLKSKCLRGQDHRVALERDREELLRKIQVFVGKATGEDRSAGRENPLNIILPAYETLWRVVMSCFLEVRFRANPQDLAQYSKMFCEFLTEPNLVTFERPHHESFLSIKNVVDEALRLYPPTRRIYRQIEDSVVAVDVENLHRQSETWGADALEFSPSRWTRNETTRSQYIPFGMGRFECPAKSLFGPMMIGILVGTLLLNVGEGFELVRDGVQGEALGPGPLESGREAHADLLLKRGL